MELRERVLGMSRIIFLLMAVALFAGCATTNETTTLQQSVYALERNMQGLNQRVQTLEQQVSGKERQDSSKAANVADLNARLEEFRVQLGKLNGRIEEQDHRIEGLSKTGTALDSSDKEPAKTSPGPVVAAEEAKPTPTIQIPKSEPPAPAAKPAPSAAVSPTVGGTGTQEYSRNPDPKNG